MHINSLLKCSVALHWTSFTSGKKEGGGGDWGYNSYLIHFIHYSQLLRILKKSVQNLGYIYIYI